MLPRFKETWRVSTISIGSSLKSKNKKGKIDFLFANAGIAKYAPLAGSPKSCLTAASLKSESHEYYYRHFAHKWREMFQRRRRMRDPSLVFNMSIFNFDDEWNRIFTQFKIHENGT